MSIPIAIVGIGCRFAGKADSPQSFYQNLRDGVDGITEAPTNRWNADYFRDLENMAAPGKMITCRGGYVEEFFEFDPESFNMSAKEALNIDPQQRLLLQVALNALEDSRLRYRGSKTGVFVGSGNTDYSVISSSSPHHMTEYSAPGSALSIHSNRLSYCFDLRGPSMTIDTACSSSGTAMFVACRSIANGDCDQAVVGGVNFLWNAAQTVAFSKLGVLSPDGRCKSFDAEANGYVRAEGCAAVVIKPLDKAERDGDHIYCVIRAVEVNEDGAMSPSLTMPSSEAQEALIRTTLAKAKISPSDVMYCEAHATGTQVGDPIEINTLGKVYSEGRDESNKLRLGCVKPNVGHTETASFLASLIKCCLMLDKKELFPNVNFSKPNPKILFDEYKMLVQQSAERFEIATNKYFAISSFGFGGANVHAILQPYVPAQRTQSWKLPQPYVYVLPAMSKNALAARVDQLKSWESNADEHQLAFTLNARSLTPYKFITYGVGNSLSTARFQDPIRLPDKPLKLVYVFSGQGPQHIEMGRSLYQLYPKFRETVDTCDNLWKKYTGVSLVHDIGVFGSKVGERDCVNNITVTLPALIFMQIALYELWSSFGVLPDAIIGHSFGEMCSIYASGSCSLETIMEVTAKRADLMTNLEHGTATMIAVSLTVAEFNAIVQEHSIEGLWIAAENAPQSITCGGYIASVQKLAAICKERNVFNRILNVTSAYHTPIMSALRDKAHAAFGDVVKGTENPKVDVISTVTGKLWTSPFTPEYFWLNVENAVLFKSAIETALQTYGEDTVFLELAPHPVLGQSIKQCGAKNVVYSQHRQEVQQVSALQAVGKLSCLGLAESLNWDQILGAPQNGVLSYLPSYPFQKKTYLADNEVNRELRSPSKYGPLIGAKLVHNSTTYQNFLNTKSTLWVQDHVVEDAVLFPAAGFIEILLEAHQATSLRDVVIQSPMTLSDSEFNIVQTTVSEDGKCHIFSKREYSEEWTMHSVGSKAQPKEAIDLAADVDAGLARCKTVISSSSCYKRFEMMKLSYGPMFQCIEKLNQGDEECVAVLRVDHLPDLSRNYVIHPSILDNCFQAFLGAMKSSAYTYLPTKLASINIFRQVTKAGLIVHCAIRKLTDKTITGDIIALDAQTKQTVLAITGFECTKIPKPQRPCEGDLLTQAWVEKTFPIQNLSTGSTLKEEAEQWVKVVENLNIIRQAMSYYISKVDLSQISATDISLQRHIAWMNEFLQKNPSVDGASAVEQLSQLANFGCEAEAIKRVGENLLELISKKGSAQAILFSDDLMSRLYGSSLTFKPSVDMFSRLVDNLTVDENRVIRILEVGSGTGTLSKAVLPFLKKYAGRIEYFFSDVSSSFFTQEKKLRDYDFVQYKIVDASKDLAEQGIANNSLDMIIGFDVVHTTKQLQECLRNLNKALVANGLFALIEPTNMQVDYMHFIFGIFSEWWQFEDDRSTCCVNDQVWSAHLGKAGFENAQFFKLADDHVHSIITARKTDTLPALLSQPAADVGKALVYKSGPVKKLLKLVQERIASENFEPVVIVTKNAQMECKNPDDAALIGFGRVLANEYPALRVYMLDFDSSISLEDEAKWISIAVNHPHALEMEHVIRNNRIYSYKLVQYAKSDNDATKVVTPFRLEIGDGILHNLSYHRSPIDTNQIADDQVLIRVKAAALNFKDVLLAMKMLDVADYLGIEFAGIVEKKGTKVSKFNVGDAVYGIAQNSLGSHVLCTTDMLCKKPDVITFEEAASMPVVFLTTYYALVKKVRMQKGDTMLVHSGAGGVGQSAIQLAKWLGATPIATVGSQSKRDFLEKKYGVKHFANSHSLDWDAEVKKQFPEGVSIVLNSLAGVHITKGLNVLASHGAFVEIGKRDIMDNTNIGLRPFLHNLSLFSVHLDLMIEDTPAMLGKILQEVNELVAQQVLTPFVDSVYPANKIVDAFKYMQSGKHQGKIIITFEDKDFPERVRPPVKLFNKDQTFILSGGLGALGFEIARWLASNGARNIVLMSRNPQLNKYQAREITELEKTGCRIVISKTDVCNAAEVLSMYAELKQIGLPQKFGVFHLAMVLQDDRITKQNDARFDAVLRPKVDGMKHLIEPLLTTPEAVQFVIAFSSISSVIGNPEQSSYASANAFIDAYTKHLVLQHGIKARSINLGGVDDVGVIANNWELRKIMLARGIDDLISSRTVLKTLESMLLEQHITQFITSSSFKELCDLNPSLRSKANHLVKHVEKENDNNEQQEGDIAESMTRRIAKILQLDATIDPNEKLTSYGVDSLLAVEISAMLSKSYGLKVSQMDILSGNASVSQLVARYNQSKQ